MIYKRVAGLPWQIIDESAVIIDPKNNRVHELNLVASYIWQKFDGQKSDQDILQSVEQSFESIGDNMNEDFKELCSNLLKEGLIECL